jgi:hypothetical protein
MLTSTDRPFLDRQATVLGIDHRWQPDPSLTVSSTLVGSDVAARGAELRDIGFTTLAQKELEGGWSHTAILIHYGKDFEVNDAGYLGRNDLNYAQWEVGRRITDMPADSAFSSHRWRWRVEGLQNTEGLWLQRQFRASRSSQYRQGGDLQLHFNARTPAFDDRITRGNGPMRVRGGANLSAYRGFARRGDWRFGAEAGAGGGLRADTAYSFSASASATRYFGDALNVELWLGHIYDQEMLIWQGGNLGPGFGNVVAGYQMNRYDLSASLNWNIGTRQELRVKLEALGFDAANPLAWRIGADGRGQRSNDPAQAFSLRYRYELAPLSDLYVVYGRGGFGSDPFAAGAFAQFGDAFSLRDEEQFLVKLAYRFEL